MSTVAVVSASDSIWRKMFCMASDSATMGVAVKRERTEAESEAVEQATDHADAARQQLDRVDEDR
jgi:hypothetical protein